MMRFQVINPADLDHGLIERWADLQQANAALSSPYFRPEFTLAVGRVRSDARVTVIEDGGRVVGFLPFQLGRFGRGRPIGGAISDYHGVIALAETQIPSIELIRRSGLSVWEFDHLLAQDQPLQGVHGKPSASPIMDLSRGYSAYVAERRAAGSEQVKKTGTLSRKLEREHGPVVFEARCLDPESLELLMKWKSQQCTQTDSIDVFGVEWSRQLMRNLLETNLSEFGGVLSTLRANGRLIAAHMGMRSDKIWHYWFPSYDHGFAQYSPGLVLLLRMAEAAQALGVSAIDLGKGDSFYKGRLANAEVALLEGRIEVPAIATSLRAMWRAAERWTDSGPTGRIIGAPIRAWRRWERSRKYK